MLHITFSKYDCIIVHKAYYLLTCTCVSINLFHSHSHSHIEDLSGLYLAPLLKFLKINEQYSILIKFSSTFSNNYLLSLSHF